MSQHVRPRRRRGYAMISVLIFLAVMLTVIGISQRQMAGLLRREHLQLQSDLQDIGAGQALAQGIELLESGIPPSSPYECETVVSTPNGPQAFTLTYTGNHDKWTVVAAPTADFATPPPIPPSFNDYYEDSL